MSAPALQAADLTTLRYWWEDLPAGFRYQTASRTVTEADVVAFAAYTADFNQMHVDAEYAAKSPFGQRVAHGMLVASYMSGLNTRTVVNQLLAPSMVGLVEVQCLFHKPTFIGDTIHVDIEVIETRPLSKGHRGMLTFRRSCVTQRGDVTVECIVKMIVLRRPEGQA